VKILAWRNPGPFGGMEPRWDVEVVREDESRERIVGLADGSVKKLVDLVAKLKARPKAEE
jgi:hypothetical protein